MNAPAPTRIRAQRPRTLLLLAVAVAFAAAPTALAARLALVVGNDSYQHIPRLINARNDARSISRELEAAGFKVTRVLDADRRTLNQQFDAFLRRIDKGAEVVFYFSGHGSQPPQLGPFLLPVDIEVTSERSIGRDGLSLEQVVDELNKRARFTLVILDACRDDPFRTTREGRSLPPGSSLSRIEPPKGTMIIMAASKGQQALDRLGPDDNVANGVFTRELVRQMRVPGLPAGEMLKRVRTNVEAAAQAVNHAQRPALVDESSSEFYFHPPRGGLAATPSPATPAAAGPGALEAPAAAQGAAAAAATAPPVARANSGPQREFDAWETASQSGQRAALEDFVREFPDGRYSTRARALLAALTAGTAPPAWHPKGVDQPVPALAEAERESWQKALNSKRRADYEAYLAAHPDGRHADRARAILRTLR